MKIFVWEKANAIRYLIYLVVNISPVKGSVIGGRSHEEGAAPGVVAARGGGLGAQQDNNDSRHGWFHITD